jgi:hypothetical protein
LKTFFIDLAHFLLTIPIHKNNKIENVSEQRLT